MLWRYSDRRRRDSRNVVARAIATGNPFEYFRTHVDEWDDVFVEDFMWLLRAYSEVNIGSHDIVDIFERRRGQQNWSSSFFSDLSRCIRDRMAEQIDVL